MTTYHFPTLAQVSTYLETGYRCHFLLSLKGRTFLTKDIKKVLFKRKNLAAKKSNKSVSHYRHFHVPLYTHSLGVNSQIGGDQHC
ncbi:hypothetical protein GDO81_009671 [Engystomops pustulosus]|uniref:Uncharacterized protein n=1 Tax=Engystomops pustulosus TaxID=76066 RepID=A0AAV7BSS7_ENGPU|nr:hypothetical protein GDO81_009671 [Engystomops pustulosus]